MKRRLLLKHLRKYGYELLREGAKHSIYYNSLNRRTTSVPCHGEIVDKLAIKICRDLEIPEP